MLIADHVRKIEKLRGLRARLDPRADFELWFWASMSAGTHAVNAALHAAGCTRAAGEFAMQPGVYLTPDAQGELKPAFRPLGDVLHVGRPPVPGPVPADVEALMHAMERMEVFRDPCVREGRPVDAAVVRECDEAFADCLALMQRVLEQNHAA
jgi:hypothetical protein